MIEGVFRGDSPVVTLTLSGENGSEDVEFVVDTGYTGFLALPESVLASVGAELAGSGYVALAGETYRRTTIYTVTVDWGGEEIEVRAQTLANDYLLGTKMLRDHQLTVEVGEGGRVLIEPM